MDSQFSARSEAHNSSGDLNPLKRAQIISYNKISARVSAAQSLTARSSSLAAQAGQDVFQACRDKFQSDRMQAACLRDIEIFIKYLVLALIAGDPSILDESLINGLRETYQALGLPMVCVITALESFRNNHKLIGLEAQLTNEYVDYLIMQLV
ncbi:MAG: hypothetical protein AAGA75_17360 [Cyanobacteria bacterium P01_E01_bin.6]